MCCSSRRGCVTLSGAQAASPHAAPPVVTLAAAADWSVCCVASQVHHFKWHAGLLHNMRDRMEWYRCGGPMICCVSHFGASVRLTSEPCGIAPVRACAEGCRPLTLRSRHASNLPPHPPLPPACLHSGDCRLGVNEGSCSPRLQHWRNAAITYQVGAGAGTERKQGTACHDSASLPPLAALVTPCIKAEGCHPPFFLCPSSRRACDSHLPPLPSPHRRWRAGSRWT